MAIPLINASSASINVAPVAPGYSLVVIGGSAGGIPALQCILSQLPANFRLPILLVQHLSAKYPSRLTEVLSYHTALNVKWAEHGEVMRPGTVYVAPQDQHLLVSLGQRLALSDADRVGWWRPAVDPLFQSAAEIYGERTIAIVLSGALWDGAKGIAAVAQAGGITMVQDDATADHFDMPAAAIDLGRADVIMPPIKIALALQLLADPVSSSAALSSAVSPAPLFR
jgi:two-component system chemotaxis response regulator CheB